MCGRLLVRSGLLVFIVFLLFAALVIQLFQWQHAVEMEQGLAQPQTAHIRTAHEKRLGQVADAEARLRQLETQLIWANPEQFLPALGTVADKLSLAQDLEPSASLVGVEELREWRRGDYGALPLKLTVSGNYTGFLTFLSVVERISPKVRIEEVRLYQRRRELTPLWMSLTLSPMYKVNTEDTVLKAATVPSLKRFMVARNPFVFDAPAVESKAMQPDDKAMPLPALTGILYNEANPIVILHHNDRRLSASVGEGIAGTTILSIHPQRVFVKRGTQRHELRLWHPNNGMKLK